MVVVLVVDMDFMSVCGKRIALSAGSKVFICMDRLIAFHDGVHFYVERTDFTHSH